MSDEPRVHFAIKRPSSTSGAGKRRTFAIQEVRGESRRTLKLEAVEAVNRALLDGQISRDEAEKQVAAVLDALYQKRDAETPRVVFHSENAALLDRYWADEYTGRDIVDPDTMLSDFKRALTAIGEVSLLVAERADLQAALDSATADEPKKQRRAADRLNTLLRHAGRPFKLRKVRARRPEVVYCTWAELQALLPYLPDDGWRLLVQAAFVTGARIGELFALKAASVRRDHVWIEAQMREDLKEDDTKTRTERRAFVLRDEAGLAIVKAWVALSAQQRAELRVERHATVIRKACRKAFGRDGKSLRAHDLRHSYAVFLITRGVPMTLVAQSLGNSIGVCERYYSGFVLVEESVETVGRILARHEE